MGKFPSPLYPRRSRLANTLQFSFHRCSPGKWFSYDGEKFIQIVRYCCRMEISFDLPLPFVACSGTQVSPPRDDIQRSSETCSAFLFSVFETASKLECNLCFVTFISFPVAKYLQQFWSRGSSPQLIRITFPTSTHSYSNSFQVPEAMGICTVFTTPLLSN